VTKVQIDLSALADSIPKQLRAQGIKVPATTSLDWERKRKAIALLRVAGLLAPIEAYRVEGRLVRAIERGLMKENP
jgi:hypothetical protein